MKYKELKLIIDLLDEEVNRTGDAHDEAYELHRNANPESSDFRALTQSVYDCLADYCTAKNALKAMQEAEITLKLGVESCED